MAISKIKTVSIEDDAITTGKIVDGTIVFGDIADDAISGAKLTDDVSISTTGNIVTTGSGSITSAGALSVGGATVFNDAGADIDFRIESNNEENMFLVDGGNDAVILGHSTKVDGINDDNEGVKGSGGQLQLHGATPVIDIFSYSTTDGTHGGINFMKSASDTVGTGALVNASDIVGSIQFGGYDGTDYASIAGKIDFQMGGATNGVAQNDTAGEMVFYTTPDGHGGSGSTERLRITHTGDTQVKTGNLVMSTSQKGIDFTAFTTSDSAGTYQGTPTVTGHVLMDYEQGTWPGEFRGAGGSQGSWAGGTATGHYTKIGRMVHIAITFQLTHRGSWTGNPQVRGLPFKAHGTHNFAVNFGHNNFNGVSQYVASVTAGQSYIYVSFADSSLQDYQTAVPAVSGANDLYAFHGWYMTND